MVGGGLLSAEHRLTSKSFQASADMAAGRSAPVCRGGGRVGWFRGVQGETKDEKREDVLLKRKVSSTASG